MLGHETARELLVARLEINERRKALLREVDALAVEAQPYDAVIAEWLADGRDVHLEYLDRAAGKWRRFSVRATAWGGVEFSPAANVSSLRLPGSPPIGADAATDAPLDDDDEDEGEDADRALRAVAKAFDIDADLDDPVSESAFRMAMETEGGADLLRALSVAEAG